MSKPIGELYHIGIVVEDFDAACASYGATLGLQWSPVIETRMEVWVHGKGLITLDFKAVYSVRGPHIEIVKAIPGTPIALRPGSPLHHLGYWSDDVTADSARLSAAGNPLVIAPMHEGKPVGMAYHQLADGTLVELVDRAAFPDWQGFLNGQLRFESAV